MLLDDDVLARSIGDAHVARRATVAVAETTAQFWWRSRAAKEARERDFPQAWAALQSALRVGVQAQREVDASRHADAVARSPFTVPKDLAHYAEGLRRAGLS